MGRDFSAVFPEERAVFRFRKAEAPVTTDESGCYKADNSYRTKNSD